jgi:hypothetical protein
MYQGRGYRISWRKGSISAKAYDKVLVDEEPRTWLVINYGVLHQNRVLCRLPDTVYAPQPVSERVAMVAYASDKCTRDHVPKEEYVERMNHGIADALLSGMCEEGITNCIKPYIPEGTTYHGKQN